MSAIDWETNAWKCLEYTSAYVAVSIHQLQVAKLMGTFLGTQIPRVHHKFPSIAGKSKFMVQYLEPLCRHVTSCNKCLQHGHGLHWFSGCVWCTAFFFLIGEWLGVHTRSGWDRQFLSWLSQLTIQPPETLVKLQLFTIFPSFKSFRGPNFLPLPPEFQPEPRISRTLESKKRSLGELRSRRDIL